MEKDSGKRLLIITVDLEEWFHILDVPKLPNINSWEKYEIRIYDNTNKILEILSKNNIKATFFILGWIAKRYPDLIKLIKKQGHEIGSHSQNHILIYKMDQRQFRKDLIDSIETLQNIINDQVIYFRAPGFSIKENSLWAIKVLGECGIKFDSSIFPASRSHGGIKSFNLYKPFLFEENNNLIKEFPISIYKYGIFRIPFSGGGYFRFIPLKVFEYFVKSSDYVITYFHPRDFDPTQPRINDIPILRKIKFYYGLNNSFEKFKKLLKKYKFISIGMADELINWNEVPIRKLKY